MEKTYRFKDLPIFHSIINNRPITNGSFPNFPGSLIATPSSGRRSSFQKGQHGKTVCDCAFDKYGKEQTSNILRDLIPPDAPQSPILHHVGKYIPRYMDEYHRQCLLDN